MTKRKGAALIAEFLSMTSSANGKRSARAPWPISLLPGPRIGFTSPTENGGKL